MQAHLHERPGGKILAETLVLAMPEVQIVRIRSLIAEALCLNDVRLVEHGREQHRNHARSCGHFNLLLTLPQIGRARAEPWNNRKRRVVAQRLENYLLNPICLTVLSSVRDCLQRARLLPPMQPLSS